MVAHVIRYETSAAGGSVIFQNCCHFVTLRPIWIRKKELYLILVFFVIICSISKIPIPKFYRDGTVPIKVCVFRAVLFSRVFLTPFHHEFFSMK
jgi:hypothetical protein